MHGRIDAEAGAAEVEIVAVMMRLLVDSPFV
jgi:hypothetical protein